LNNNAVSSHEFDAILSEFQQYNFLKDQIRVRMLRQPSTRKLPDVDVQKLEKDIGGRLEAQMIKKSHETSRFELNFERKNTKLSLCLVKNR